MTGFWGQSGVGGGNMRRLFGWKVLTGLGLVTALVFTFGVVGAGSAPGDEHGLGASKVCNTPTKILSLMTCSMTIRNTSDDFKDDMKTLDLIDTVVAADGNHPSGNVIHDGRLVIVAAGLPGPGSTTVTHCEGGTGSGTVADPYLNSTFCVLNSGARLQALDFSHYAPTAADFHANAGHVLTDQAVARVTDLCTNPAGQATCPTQPLSASPNSNTVVQQLTSTTATQIHDGAHNAVTAVAVGTTVHD